MYIALIEVTEHLYMAGSALRTEVHIVDADSINEATEKLEEHYAMQSSQYNVTYSINITSINELIK